MAKITIKELEAKLAAAVKENRQLQTDGEIAVTLINRQAQQISDMQDNVNVLNDSLRGQAAHMDLLRSIIKTNEKQISVLSEVEPLVLMLKGMVPTINLNVSAFDKARDIVRAAAMNNSAGNQDGCNIARRNNG